MSCGCGQSDPIYSPEDPNALKPVVFDPVTNEIRPIAFGEALPEAQCPDCSVADAVVIPTKRLETLYAELYRKLKLLEEKFCNCVEGAPDCPECPEPEVSDCDPLYIAGGREDGQEAWYFFEGYPAYSSRVSQYIQILLRTRSGNPLPPEYLVSYFFGLLSWEPASMDIAWDDNLNGYVVTFSEPPLGNAMTLFIYVEKSDESGDSCGGVFLFRDLE